MRHRGGGASHLESGLLPGQSGHVGSIASRRLFSPANQAPVAVGGGLLPLGRSWHGRRRERVALGVESGLPTGFRLGPVQSAEAELEIGIPQVGEAAETFVSKLFPWTSKLLRTEGFEGVG